MNDTHLTQTVDIIELLAFLKADEGLAQVEITVLNGWKLDALNTFGRPHSDFADLKECVRERLEQAGVDLRNFDYGDWFKNK
jgi:hypothetical protein